MTPSRPDELDDQLDALLDGRPIEVDDALGSLVEVAGGLRAALAGIELDPAAAERHLAQVLDGRADGAAPVLELPPPLPEPARIDLARLNPARLDPAWRVRLAAAAVAAALLVPAMVGSLNSLPGQPLYAVKLAVEQARVAAVSWSDPREAGERTTIAGTRLNELDRLIKIGDASRIPHAIIALNNAVAAAQRAVADASRVGDAGQMRAVARKLVGVQVASSSKLAVVVSTFVSSGSQPDGTVSLISAAVIKAQPTMTTPVGGGGTIVVPASTIAPTEPSGPATTPSTSPSQQSSPPTTSPPPPPTTSPSTAPPTTDTAPPTSGGGSGSESPPGGQADSAQSDRAAPPST